MLNSGLSTISRRVLDLNRTGLGDDVILAAVLITECVSTNNDWLGPAWDATRDIRDDDRLSEHGTIKDVSDRSIGTPPHLLKVEFFNSTFVRSDSRALHGNLMPLSCFGGIDGNLVIRGISAGHRQVIVLSLHVDIGMDVALLNPLPDDARHFVTIHVNDGVCNLNLAESGREVSLVERES